MGIGRTENKGSCKSGASRTWTCDCPKQSGLGVAYRDHNYGSNPMQADFKDWYWGRVHTEQSSFVFLTTPRSDDNSVFVGSVNDGGTELDLWKDVVVNYRERRPTMFGLNAARAVELKGVDNSGRSQSVLCRNRRIVENGPFYQRYISDWYVNGDFVGVGTSEYMDVRRLGKPWIRPFLRLPWFLEGDT